MGGCGKKNELPSKGEKEKSKESPPATVEDDDYEDGDYSDAQTSPSEVAPSVQTIVAVQKELAKLGYYYGQIDGIVGPETRKAISWFQSVDKLSVSGRIDDPTLKALQIS